MTLFYDTPAENMCVGDRFLLAGNRCVVTQIYTSDGGTRIVFSFLKIPDSLSTIYCRSDYVFTIMLNRRSTTV